MVKSTPATPKSVAAALKELMDAKDTLDGPAYNIIKFYQSGKFEGPDLSRTQLRTFNESWTGSQKALNAVYDILSEKEIFALEFVSEEQLKVLGAEFLRTLESRANIALKALENTSMQVDAITKDPIIEPQLWAYQDHHFQQIKEKVESPVTPIAKTEPDTKEKSWEKPTQETKKLPEVDTAQKKHNDFIQYVEQSLRRDGVAEENVTRVVRDLKEQFDAVKGGELSPYNHPSMKKILARLDQEDASVKMLADVFADTYIDENDITLSTPAVAAKALESRPTMGGRSATAPVSESRSSQPVVVRNYSDFAIKRPKPQDEAIIAFQEKLQSDFSALDRRYQKLSRESSVIGGSVLPENHNAAKDFVEKTLAPLERACKIHLPGEKKIQNAGLEELEIFAEKRGNLKGALDQYAQNAWSCAYAVSKAEATDRMGELSAVLEEVKNDKELQQRFDKEAFFKDPKKALRGAFTAGQDVPPVPLTVKSKALDRLIGEIANKIAPDSAAVREQIIKGFSTPEGRQYIIDHHQPTTKTKAEAFQAKGWRQEPPEGYLKASIEGLDNAKRMEFLSQTTDFFTPAVLLGGQHMKETGNPTFSQKMDSAAVKDREALREISSQIIRKTIDSIKKLSESDREKLITQCSGEIRHDIDGMSQQDVMQTLEKFGKQSALSHQAKNPSDNWQDKDLGKDDTQKSQEMIGSAAESLKDTLKESRALKDYKPEEGQSKLAHQITTKLRNWFNKLKGGDAKGISRVRDKAVAGIKVSLKDITGQQKPPEGHGSRVSMEDDGAAAGKSAALKKGQEEKGR